MGTKEGRGTPEFSSYSVTKVEELRASTTAVAPTTGPIDTHYALSLDISFVEGARTTPGSIPGGKVGVPRGAFVVYPFLVFCAFY